MSKYSKDNENIKGKRMSDWKTVKIGDICEQINGVSYKPADVYDSLNENATVLLRANNIFEDKLNYDELVFVDKKRVSDIQYMKKGDILICASSGSKHLVGKAACLSEDKELTFGAFCKVLRPKTVNPEFIKHYFFSPSYRTEISRLSEGANINNIKAADLDNLTLPLPTESEQKKIAKQLDKCIKIINNQKRSLEKYDLLIKSRFIEMFGENPVENGKWKVMKLNTISDVRDGTHDSPSYYSEGYPFITTKNLIDGTIDFSKASLICKEDYELFDRRSHVDNGDILMPMIGTIGGAILVKKDREFAIKNVALIKPNEENTNLNFNFLLYVLNSDFMVNHFNRFKTGGTQKFISLGFIRELPIPVPSLELQNSFAAFVQQIDKSKSAVQKSLEKTETLYKSLMQQYFG